jgi:hypothetical protein
MYERTLVDLAVDCRRDVLLINSEPCQAPSMVDLPVGHAIAIGGLDLRGGP